MRFLKHLAFLGVISLTGILQQAACGAPWQAARATWLWSVPIDHGRAFLWIPPNCQQLRAVVVGQNNMIELGILEHPEFRKALAEEGIGEIFIAPPFDFIFRFDQDAGERFNEMVKRLAEVSGYSELNIAPVVPLGHSACASFPWNFAAWNPARTLAILSVHGDAPLTKLTGCGKPSPDWGNRTLDGIPGLMVMGEYEWGEERLAPALAYKKQHPKTPIAMLAEPGSGHFNYSDELVRYLARFVSKAAEARLPKEMSLQEPPVLKPVDPATGWLVERWHPNKPRQIAPAPHASYQGDPDQAFWCFDQEMALATEHFMADQAGKTPQLLSISDGQMPLEETSGEPVTPRFLPDADGVTFHLKTAFLDFVPGSSGHNGNASHWASAPAGSPLGHAAGGGPIELHKIVGPVVQTGTNSFQFAMNRVSSTEDRRNFDIWVWASHPGDQKYKAIVQQAMIRVPMNTEGKEQHIDFPTIPNQKAGIPSLKLEASSDAGTKVRYYVLEGPAEVENDLLKFSGIPPRSKFPIKITVVAWQHGLPGKIQSAQPVSREFFITK